ncbi:MAG: cytochrome ubiquinol oxidase subunit I, partial [Planctomycetes bacterium]|nr:cytochrome ubiquinol oxidase subunit I [Planctomycetota bacterium]
MHYPEWFVPHLPAPMLIAVVAVIHVLVSHYAVGGGLFLAVEVGHAYRTANREYLAYLKRHARFFLLLTVVFGAVTGVGIWFTIGLASPLATEMLIRTFVFGWAIEWVFFLVEVVSIFFFYYYWDRLPEKTHTTIGWIYGASAWISLVLITGITAFMLNPGDWPEKGGFWVAFFNPQFLPQVVARTGGALLLGSMYVYLHASLSIQDAGLRDRIQFRSTRPAMLGALLIAAGGLGWFVFLPPSARAILESAAVLNVLVALLFAITGVVFAALYMGPYRNPGWLTPGFAGMMLIFGLAAMATGEFVREAVRKPYVIYDVSYSNQILRQEVPRLQQGGYLDGGTWTRALVQDRYPQVVENGHIVGARLLELPEPDRIEVGHVLFQYHCNQCHAGQRGHSAVGPLLRGRSPSAIRERIEHLDDVLFMPPWAGTAEEADLLTEYLVQIAPTRDERPGKRGQDPFVRST